MRLEGARRQAERTGYRLEPFYIGHEVRDAGVRTQRILQARGIRGVILAAFSDQMIEFALNWDDFVRFSLSWIRTMESCCPELAV